MARYDVNESAVEFVRGLGLPAEVEQRPHLLLGAHRVPPPTTS